MSEYEGKYIKVKILEGDKMARGVNKIKKPLLMESKYSLPLLSFGNKYYEHLENWQEAESKLRTFEIEEIVQDYAKEIVHKSRGLYFAEICQELIGKIKSAEILPNGKVRII